MTTFALLIFVLYTHLLGLGVIRLLKLRTAFGAREESLGMAGIIGGATTFVITLAIVMFKLPIHLASFLIPALTLGIAGSISRTKQSRVTLPTLFTPLKCLRWYEWALLAFILLQIIQMTFTALWWPVTMQDDWAQWSANAKYLFHHGAVDNLYFKHTNHSNYPLFLMSNAVLLCRMNLGWSDFICNAFPTLMVFDFALILLGYLGQRCSRAFGLGAVFILMATPIVSRVGRDGTAEIPSAVMVALAAIYLLKAIKSQRRAGLFCFGLLAGLIPAVKAEGFAITVLMITVYLFYSWKDNHLKITSTALVIVPGLAFNLAWRYLMWAGDCNATRFHLFTLTWLTDPASLKDLGSMVMRLILPSKDHLYLLGTGLPLATTYYALKNRGDRESFILLALFVLIAAAYAVGCYSTEHGNEYFRLLWHTMFIVLLFSARQIDHAQRRLSHSPVEP